MSSSTAFGRLHPLIQRWVWQQGWPQLRDIQERAIPVLMDAGADAIIAAATASGKTEAAFLPLLTRVLEAPAAPEANLLCISPLKALINDQVTRLESMCHLAELPAFAWHGDVAVHRKKGFLKTPRGVVVITPESLEAMLVNRGIDALRPLFQGTQAIVVDELHAFIGEERGKQLQSLMHRIDAIAGRKIQRVGLSATLGDMSLAAEFLRPGAAKPAALVVSDENTSALQVQVRGYEYRAAVVDEASAKALEKEDKPVQLEEVVPGNVLDIAQDIYRTMQGHNNLVFPNSRRSVEVYSDLLRRMCEREGRPNEFWPHHGSLAKDVRSDAEAALKDVAQAATAIATTTLELGIDVGSVRSVAQVDSPPSVASLRQRLGRSGRREGESAILRAYCSELPLELAEDPADRLRESLVQTTAMVSLLIARWCEPPRAQGLHLSTLVQQLLALIAERSGVSAAQAYQILVQTGPFRGVSKAEFAVLLRHLAEKDLLMQDSQRTLFHGAVAERIVNNFEFYASFATKEEYRLQIAGGQQLGSLPLEKPVTPGDHLVFGGRRWKVGEVDSKKKLITVTAAKGARPPSFEGSGVAPVHERVRQEMRRLYQTSDEVPFLNKAAATMLKEARSTYTWLGLSRRNLVPYGSSSLLFTWKGDALDSALALMLTAAGISATSRGVCIEIHADTSKVQATLTQLASEKVPDAADLAALVLNRELEKWDWALPDELLNKAYASLWLDVAGAHDWCQEFVRP
jgi:ATP-dependent helicase Lhr and Lhr-like helicase